MSTNPKTTMPSFKAIDRDIRALTADIEQANALMPETQEGRVARLIRIYSGIKPLLTVLTALPLIPSSWRTALAVFNTALAAVARVLRRSTPASRLGAICSLFHAVEGGARLARSTVSRPSLHYARPSNFSESFPAVLAP